MSSGAVWGGSVVAAAIILSGCGGSTAAPDSTSSLTDRGPLTVYSGQHEQTVQALVKDFESRTGAKANVRSGDEVDLAKPASAGGGRLARRCLLCREPPAISAVDSKKLLAPVEPATLGAVPPAVERGVRRLGGPSLRVRGPRLQHGPK